MKKRILIIDDLKSWQEVYMNIFNEIYDLIIVDCFEKALTIIKHESYDLVILDIRLDNKNNENVDGLNLLKLIKRINPTIPIVIVSGFPEIFDKQILLDNKPDRKYLKANINIHVLKKDISDLLMD
ncbi:response regulator [bacterium]|nr:MAG: response regulator [bacterium]